MNHSAPASPGQPADRANTALRPLDALCLTWRDSNGHIFTVTAAEPLTDPQGGPWDTRLIGESTGCDCRFLHHDGDSEREVEWEGVALRQDMFGFEPHPNNLRDMTLYATHLFELPESEFRLIMTATESGLRSGSVSDVLEEDMEDSLSLLARGVFYALQVFDGPRHSPGLDWYTYRSLHLLTTMRHLGHTSPRLAAAAVRDPASVPGNLATRLPTTMTPDDVDAYVASIAMLEAFTYEPPQPKAQP